MPTQEEQEALEGAQRSLQRIQEFDPGTLPRDEDLGKSYSFSDAVAPAEKLVTLFRRLAPSALEDFGTKQCNQVQQQADSCFNLFDSVLQFDPTQSNAHETRQQIIQNIDGAYQGAFTTLFPFIGYSLYKSADFQRLETDARAALQKIRDDAAEITGDLEKQKADAEAALDAIRKVAAEQGVTQQAIYFKNEADECETNAETWRSRTINLAWLLGGYSLLSLVLHKIPFLAPANSYETVQLAISKVLVFAVISFMLFLASKNFLSNRHNAVVNRHRQNALMTYKALVEAAGETQQASDAVLVHAAACIYAPQPTGYTGTSGEGQTAKSVIELLSKPISSAAK